MCKENSTPAGDTHVNSVVRFRQRVRELMSDIDLYNLQLPGNVTAPSLLEAANQLEKVMGLLYDVNLNTK